MKYEVIEYFTDLQDGNYAYKTSDVYPRDGYKPTAERIEALSSDKNVRKHPIIKAIETAEAETVAEVAEEKPKRKRKKAE